MHDNSSAAQVEETAASQYNSKSSAVPTGSVDSYAASSTSSLVENSRPIKAKKTEKIKKRNHTDKWPRLKEYVRYSWKLWRMDLIGASLMAIGPLATILLNLLWFIMSSFDPMFYNGVLSYMNKGSLLTALLTTAITVLTSLKIDQGYTSERIVLGSVIVISTLIIGFQSGYVPSAPYKICVPLLWVIQIGGFVLIWLINAHNKVLQLDVAPLESKQNGEQPIGDKTERNSNSGQPQSEALKKYQI